MAWLIGFGVTVREISMVKISKKLLSQLKIPKIFRVDIVLIVAQSPKIHSIFERAKQDLLDVLKYFPQIVTDFSLSSAEKTEIEPFFTF